MTRLSGARPAARCRRAMLTAAVKSFFKQFCNASLTDSQVSQILASKI